MYRNICLIGLPFSGKSLLGKRLSIKQKVGFIEIDKMIEYKCQSTIPKILKYTDAQNFINSEEHIASTIHCENTIISTGGSIVYSNDAMRHLQKTLQSKVVFLDLTFDEFKKRYEDTTIPERGIVNPDNLSLDQFYFQRTNLYNLYADQTIDADNKRTAYRLLEKDHFNFFNL